MTIVHPWVFSNNCAGRYGSLAPQAVHLAEYAVELAKAYGQTPGRPVWVQEIGAPAPHIPGPDAPAFAERSLANVLTCTDLWGVTWWCSHDVDKDLADFPPLEYTLGLFTSDHKRKPVAEVYASFALGAGTAVVAAAREKALAFDPADRAATGPGGEFFETWMEAAADGERLAISLEAL